MLMLRYVLAFIVLLGAGSALAQDRVVERLWLADPTGELTLVDVQSMPWQPAPRKLSRGYTADTVWMRLLVQVPDASPVAVNVRPSYLDDVRLHVPDPDHPGRWVVRVTGDTPTPSRSGSALQPCWVLSGIRLTLEDAKLIFALDSVLMRQRQEALFAS